jgi:hypothetical protein
MFTVGKELNTIDIVLAKLKLAWWWYITIEQYPYHPKKYRKYSTLTEKRYRDDIAQELYAGKPISSFSKTVLIFGGFI